MSQTTKTDNHNPAAKLDLRRHFLRKYHDDALDVFDCCQGSGLLWRQLREEFAVRRYWGVDLKPKPGRLKLDSVRVLQQRGLSADVIDIDTYGSPWKHWAALLPNVTRPVTVFLTIGATMFGGSVDSVAAEAMGLRFRRHRLPVSFGRKLSDLSLPYCLHLADRHGLKLAEVQEAESNGSARYFGVRIAPPVRKA